MSHPMAAIFKKYIRTKAEDKKHSKYSPSGMDRILGCLGSTQLNDGLPSVDSKHSVRGTNTHTLMEYFFKEQDAEKNLRHVAAMEFKKHLGYDSEMHQAALVAVKHARAVFKQMHEKAGVKPTLLIEEKSRVDEIVKDDCGGTADIVMYHLFGTLHIMDYKNGVSVVEPEENKQLMTYALGVLHKLGWDFYDVHLTIIQPNAPHKLGPVRTWKTTVKRMQQFERELVTGIKASKKPNAPLVPDSKYCYFCPANQARKCPAQQEKSREKILDRFQKTSVNTINKGEINGTKEKSKGKAGSKINGKGKTKIKEKTSGKENWDD